MEPIHYLKIFRRRWWLVAALTVVGVVLGLASSRVTGDGGDDSNFYAATHTLIAEGSDDPATGTNAAAPAMNYELMSYLARTGEVPELVAEQLGGDPIRLASRVALTPNPALGTLEVTATGTSARETEELADVYATTLRDFLAERERAMREEDIASLEGRIATLDRQLAELDAQLLGGADPAVIDPEKQLLADDRAAVRRELADLREALDDPPRLTTLTEAEAVELGPEQYAAALASIETKDSDVQSARDAQIQAAQEAATASDGPGAVTRAGVGGLVGLLAGIVAVLVLDRLDTRVRSRDDVEEALGMPVLAEIPRLTKAQLAPGEVVSWSHPRSRAAEAFRVLRSAILYAHTVGSTAPANTNGTRNGAALAGPDRPAPGAPPRSDDRTGKVLLVTSPGPAEGKTTITANLAAVLAEAGYRVLALNCDYRRPKLHEQYGVRYEPRRVIDTHVPGVSLIADVIDDTSQVNPAEVVAAQREVIEKARDMFDVIVLDTAPLLTTNDASDLLPVVDMVVIATRGGRTTRDAADRAAELLERRAARVVGAVLVDGELESSTQYYYYRDAYYDDAAPASPRQPADLTSADGGRDETSPVDPATPSGGSGEADGLTAPSLLDDVTATADGGTHHESG